MRNLLLAALVSAAAPGMTVSNGWSRATYGPGATAVGYLLITSHGAADRLTGATCAGAGMTMIHQTGHGMTMGSMSMDHMAALDSVPIPAGGSVVFQPGGLHLMLMDTTRQLRPGDTIACTLHFATGGNVPVRLSVQRPGDTAYTPP